MNRYNADDFDAFDNYPRGKKKGKKELTILYRFKEGHRQGLFPDGHKWTFCGRYYSEKDREQALDNYNRKQSKWFEYKKGN